MKSSQVFAIAIKIANSIVKEPDKQRVVAILTNKRGQIISIGINSYHKTHTKQAHYAKKSGNSDKIFLHAEISALVKCKEKPYSIHVVRTNAEGKECLAKPCELCSLALKEAGIKKIYYTK